MLFGGASHLGDNISMSLDPSFFGTIPLSSALFQLHILCLAQLLLTPRITCLRCAHLLVNLQTLLCFCTINPTQSYKGRIFSPWLSQVVITGLEPATPRWESWHCDTQPIRFACLQYQVVSLALYVYAYIACYYGHKLQLACCTSVL